MASQVHPDAPGVENQFEVLFQGQIIGNFAFQGTSAQQRHHFDITFEHPEPFPLPELAEEGEGVGALMPDGGGLVLEVALRAASTVPPGMSSWDWVPGGHVELWVRWEP